MFIINAKTGEGILVTQGRIPFYNLLGNQEKGLFTTKPKEFAA